MRHRIFWRGGLFCLLVAGGIVGLTLRTSRRDISAAAPKATVAPIAPAVLHKFSQWSQNYREAAAAKATVEREGIELARQRRAELRQLIQTDPKAALQWAVPLAVRRELPEAVQSLLE